MLPEAVKGANAAWKERLHIHPVPDVSLAPTVSARHRQILALLAGHDSMLLGRFAEFSRTTAATLRRMEEKGLVRIAPATVERDPYANELIVATESLKLCKEQAVALSAINLSLDSPTEASDSATFLLHGVTGSGKTEVYLQAIALALAKGKGAIVLVPEISLTPQTVERFKARFGSGPVRTAVAVLHSHLSSGERHDEWHKIRDGRAKIVIGARSAIFAPVEPLGLIIVDEEHEHSYKQEEAPRYNARDVAVVRGQMEKATVVLGTATPSMESFHNAKKGKYRLLELPTRADNAKMPIVRVVDMRMVARKQKDQTVLSPQLKEAILKRLEQKEQVMLFLNRRGFATSMQCPKCGYIAQCPNCSISLTYHRAAQQLRCHICNHQSKAPSVCPEASCGNPAIRFAGLGTEKVEATLAKIFPHARISRMDSDTLKRKEDYRRILGDFRTGKIDILVGTQMIAKGLHFPNVTLVGIIHADLGLHVPDFRAGERTFQLLTQVAGRAGRGDIEGEVFVQAFTPFHPAIQYSRRHDVLGFYEQEIEFREQLRYPPFARVALLTFKGRNEEKVEFTAKHFRKLLDPLSAEFPDLKLAGPAPAPLAKAETFHRFQIMLRAGQMSRLSRRLSEISLANRLPEDIRLVIDIDPMNLM
jgi:primosomal protein N' (replication factor Y) (superfamily II helicase)